jgi:hypothetical protein
LKEYINWYQYTLGKLNNFNQLSFMSKLSFMYVLISTKNWSSYLALCGFAVFLIFSFGIFFYLLPGSWFNSSFHSKGFFDSFYWSFMNFTSLGPGSLVVPLTIPAKILIMVESVLGYVILGELVFLIGHRVSKLF